MESTRVDDAVARVDPATGIDTQVAQLGRELVRHSRLLHLMKAQLADIMPTGVEWAAFGVLSQLTRCGPTRQSDLAGMSLLDPSTISRHVGQLVRQGLVERRADPQDGRAVRLVATDRARAIVEDTIRHRNQMFLAALQGWDLQDLRTLTDLLARFSDDLESFWHGTTRAGPDAPPPPHDGQAPPGGDAAPRT